MLDVWIRLMSVFGSEEIDGSRAAVLSLSGGVIVFVGRIVKIIVDIVVHLAGACGTQRLAAAVCL